MREFDVRALRRERRQRDGAAGASLSAAGPSLLASWKKDEIALTCRDLIVENAQSQGKSICLDDAYMPQLPYVATPGVTERPRSLPEARVVQQQ